MRAAFGFAAALLVSSLALEARAQDASPWQQDGHSAVRLLAGSRSGAVLLGGIAFQLQPGWKTYWRTPGDSGVPPRFDFSKSDNVEAVTVLWPAPVNLMTAPAVTRWAITTSRAAVAYCREKCRQTGDASRRHQLRGLREALHSCRSQSRTRLHQRGEHRGQRAVRSARHRAEARQYRRSQSADHPRRQARRQIHRAGRRRHAADAEDVNLFVEGPTPDWALPVPKLLEHSPPGVKRFAFELDGLPPGANPDGAALKLTLVGGDRSYEFNINLN